ncbi:hypothetical protein MRB53_015388 [Persea americana]|uniref:Uncharacterized protein n=1 Tax=Persea americana TaxID=3435 RepID=A0ACC2KDZ7_PERAE|nr:hypothetical protein MRB53_015388 [Persea americana]
MRKLIWVFCVLGVWAACNAVAGAVGGVGDDPCMTDLAGMIDCIGYVTNGSKVNKPPPACCKEVKPVLEQHAVCLCVILTPGAEIYGIAINVTRAMGLPPTCGLAPFNTSICQSPSPGPSPPGPTPGPSPAPSPPAPVPVPVPPSPTDPAPSPSEASSAGMLSVSIVVALFIFAVAVGSNV